MAQDDRVVVSVRRKIRDEDGRAKALLRGIDESSIRDMDTVIAQLFPETSQLAESLWSNVPRGVRLSHYMFVGVPAIVDLRAVTPEQFESLYGISIRAMEELVGDGWVLLNLYERSNPEVWAGATHFEGLLQRSIVNGARTDAYITRLVPEYKRLQDQRCAEFLAAFTRAPDDVKEETMALAYQDDPGLLPAVVGKQWAYLDAFAPDSSLSATQLIEQGRLGHAVALMRMVRRNILSRHTGSLGGEFVWSDHDFGQWAHGHDLGAPSDGRFTHSPGSSDVEVAWRRAPDVFRSVIGEFATIPGVKVFERPSMQTVLDLRRHAEWHALRSGVIGLIRHLAAGIEENRYDPRDVEELRRYVYTMRDVLARWQGVVGERGTTFVEGVTRLAMGVLGGPELGTIFSGIVGIGAEDLARLMGSQTTEIVRQVFRPRRHRIVANLDRVEKALAQGRDPGRRRW